MALLHRCHTCNQQYENNARYCPGCGKPLGHKEPRADGNVYLTEQADNRLQPWFVCSGCGRVTEGRGYGFCPHCGAYVNAYRMRPRVSDEMRRLREAGVTGNLFIQAVENVKAMGDQYTEVKPYEFAKWELG